MTWNLVLQIIVLSWATAVPVSWVVYFTRKD